MSQADTDDACPNCNAPNSLYREPNCVHGGPGDVTSGVACMECNWYRVDERDDEEFDEVAFARAQGMTERCPSCECVVVLESKHDTGFYPGGDEGYDSIAFGACECGAEVSVKKRSRVNGTTEKVVTVRDETGEATVTVDGAGTPVEEADCGHLAPVEEQTNHAKEGDVCPDCSRSFS